MNTTDKTRTQPYRDTEPALYTAKELAERLGKDEKTLYNWRKKGIGPKYRQVGTTYIYMQADVEQWAKDTFEPFIKFLEELGLT
jgi:predicted DNA-binding transcriptional regulator AlpA